jgi:hypothetical protein
MRRVGGGWSAMVLKECPRRPRGSSLVRERERPAGRAAAAAGRVGARCGHESLRTLVSCGHRARVDGHVPLSQWP